MPQQPKTPKIKHRAKVRLTDSKGQTINVGYWSSGVQEFTDTYGRHAHLTLPVPTTIGKPEKFTVTVEYLGEKQYKQSYEKRVKALAKSEERREKWEKESKRLTLEKNEKELLQRRQRIVNQIELAFVKQDGAVDFITCDDCDAPVHRSRTYLREPRQSSHRPGPDYRRVVQGPQRLDCQSLAA